MDDSARQVEDIASAEARVGEAKERLANLQATEAENAIKQLKQERGSADQDGREEIDRQLFEQWLNLRRARDLKARAAQHKESAGHGMRLANTLAKHTSQIEEIITLYNVLNDSDKAFRDLSDARQGEVRLGRSMLSSDQRYALAFRTNLCDHPDGQPVDPDRRPATRRVIASLLVLDQAKGLSLKRRDAVVELQTMGEIDFVARLWATTRPPHQKVAVITHTDERAKRAFDTCHRLSANLGIGVHLRLGEEDVTAANAAHVVYVSGTQAVRDFGIANGNPPIAFRDVLIEEVDSDSTIYRIHRRKLRTRRDAERMLSRNSPSRPDRVG